MLSEHSRARNKRILEEATKLARVNGYQWITRADVAAASGVSPGTINTAFGTMDQLKKAVLRHAVESWDSEDLVIVAQGLGDRHPIAMAAPHTRRMAAALLAAAVQP